MRGQKYLLISFVVVMVEVDYKVSTKTEKFMTGYVDRYVTDYAL